MDNAQTTVSFETNPGIMYKLGHIEAQLAAINSKLDLKESTQDIEIAALRKDVSQLKDWRMLQLGAAGAISFVIGILTKVITWPS